MFKTSFTNYLYASDISHLFISINKLSMGLCGTEELKRQFGSEIFKLHFCNYPMTISFIEDISEYSFSPKAAKIIVRTVDFFVNSQKSSDNFVFLSILLY